MDFFDNYKEKIEYFRKAECFRDYIASLEACYNQGLVNYQKPFDYDSYMDFFYGSGERLPYEIPYFEIRKRLTCGVLLYLYSEDETYLKEINNLIWRICGEVTWTLPAHAKMRENLAEDISQRIDLFSAETAFYLAETSYILKDVLPKEIRLLVKSFVAHRIFDAFESNSFWWESSTNNWSAVCAGSVGMAYLYLAPERFERVKQRLFNAMACFLSGYGDDGCCTEGVSYWNYGFGHFVIFADALYRFTDGKEDLLHREKVEKIAYYLQKTVLREGMVATFSDCAAAHEFSDVGLYCCLAETFKNFQMPKACMEFGAMQGKLSTHLRNVLWYSEKSAVPASIQGGTDYFESAQWYIHRREGYSFAAKAGHNREEHNHNDVGSFLVATDRGQVLTDIGAMVYDKYTFSEKRYELLHNSSLGHSVPIVNGKAQPYGREFCGKVLEAGESCFRLEMGSAYGLQPEAIVREFTLNEKGITLTDCFQAPCEEVIERFVTPFEPEIRGEDILLPDLLLKAKGFHEVTKHTLMNHYGMAENYYLIDYRVEKGHFALEISVCE